MRTIKYKGKKFGKLTIIEEPTGTGNHSKVKTRCDCGNISERRFPGVLSGNSLSCGCIKFTAGRESKTNPLYSIYRGICDRCNNRNNKDYPRYGGRGIKMIWKNFIEFKNDLEKSYLIHCKKYGKKNTSIERINSNKNYCKKNCKWATSKEQSLNKRTSKFLTINGITKNYCEWARQIGCSRQALRYRVIHGLKPELILITPFKYSNRYDPKTL